MKIEDIPFDDFDLDPIRGSAIVASLVKMLEVYPDQSIDIQKLSNNSLSTPVDVKKVLYYLFYKGLVKAKYTLFHQVCGHALSRPESSMYDLVLDDYVNELCVHCPDPIGDVSELEIRMYFWRNGSLL